MARIESASVLIVGAGPVGMTLAMDLASRGIDVLVADTRPAGAAPESVKCNHVSARSMEIFRRLGVARAVRNAGLPADYPNDVAYRTTSTGYELSRIPIPCRRDRYDAVDGPDTWWPTPEPPHRINQVYLEPVLYQHAMSLPGLRVLGRTRIEHLAQRADGVRAEGSDEDTGERIEIACRYLVGCDGASSNIRKIIGAKLSGDSVVQAYQSTYIRAPELIRRFKARPAWMTSSLNPRRCGTMMAIDGRETWLIHNALKSGETVDTVDRDASLRAILGVDQDFKYEIISRQDWVGRRLLADKFREGRVFLCGDSAHIWIAYAGYGMNAGIADAANLAWVLAAHLKGWAPEAILDAYEAERFPITEQVSQFAMAHTAKMRGLRTDVDPMIEDSGPEGARLREELGRAAYDTNVQQYCCAGLNFGYFYAGSPLIAYDTEQAPAYDMASFVSSTVPGCRLPHYWLPDGSSLYDAIAGDYALLRFDRRIDVTPLERAAAAVGMPLRVRDVTPPGDTKLGYRHALVLARPDQHVAWRGDTLPDSAWLVDLLRGSAYDRAKAAHVAAS